MKRPLGMTILLVLSLLNASLQIFNNLFLYIAMPILEETMDSGALGESFGPLLGSQAENIADMMDLLTSVNPLYFLFTGLLYICSLVGVLRMFKIQRLGFHVYSISQLLILIVGVVFIYSKQTPNPFFSEFLTTLMMILIYHLYFKRMELKSQFQNPDEPEENPSDRE